MKAYEKVDIYIYIQNFLTSALVGGEWSASHPGRFTPEENPTGTHWIRGWVELRAGLDDVEKRKFRSQSLYRLGYPGSSCRSEFEPGTSWMQTTRSVTA
jgi:hypothetical protein